MSYGYPGPGGEQQPPPQSHQPPQWQQPEPGWQQPGPGWGGPPQPPRKSKTGLIVGLSIAGPVVVLIALGVIGVMAVSDGSPKDGGPFASSTASEQSGAEATATATEEEPTPGPGAEGDVKITGCELDSLTTWASAKVLITNRTSKKADYIVDVEFVNSSGKRVGEALAAVNNLAPGRRTQETAQGLDTITGKIECKVTKVTRYVS